MEAWIGGLIGLAGVIAGLFVKAQFDTRDLRREVLQKPLKEFDRIGIEYRYDLKNKLMVECNRENWDEYHEYVTRMIKRLDDAYVDLLHAAKIVRDKDLAKNVESVCKILRNAIYDQDFFYRHREESKRTPGFYQEINEMRKKGEKSLETEYYHKMDKVYDRYWKLINSIWVGTFVGWIASFFYETWQCLKLNSPRPPQ